jgi:haloalkane dehalogenase
VPLSADPRYARSFVDVDGVRMAYVEVPAPPGGAGRVGDERTGAHGDPIVFLHGNPTSSYLWRNVMPHLEGLGRLLAPDLVGMGDSAKLPGSGPERYTFAEHARYLDGLFDRLGVRSDVTLVVHDWGSALGFHWANRHRDAVKGIAYMEAIVRPVTTEEWPGAARRVFQGFRSPAGDEMVLEKNVFVERVLPGSVLRTLTDEEMAHYRRPFRNPGEDRRPTLTWPRQIPLDGEPADVAQLVSDYAEWLSTSPVPKLFVNAEPGAILVGAQREFCRAWPNQEEVTVAGNHFLQEDSPDDIGRAVASWYRRL